MKTAKFEKVSPVNAAAIAAAFRANFMARKVDINSLPGWEVTLPAAPANAEAYASVTAQPAGAPVPILLWWAKCSAAPQAVRILRPKAFPRMTEEDIVLSVAPGAEPLRDVAGITLAAHAAVRAIDRAFGGGRGLWEKFAPHSKPGRLVAMTKPLGEIYSEVRAPVKLYKLNLRRNETPVWEYHPGRYFSGFSKELDYTQLSEPAILRWTPEGVLLRLRDGNLIPAPTDLLNCLRRFSREALEVVDAAAGNNQKVYARFVRAETETGEITLDRSVAEVYNLPGAEPSDPNDVPELVPLAAEQVRQPEQ